MGFNALLPVWNKAGVAPSGTKQTNGWVVGERPPADWFNWHWNTTYLALKELQENAIHKGGAATTAVVPNLNADLLDGFNTATVTAVNTVAVRDANGDLEARVLRSTVATGVAPFAVASTTVVPNLNADLLDGFHADAEPNGNTVARRNSLGNLHGKVLVSEAAQGTAPFSVASTTVSANLNADMVDGYHLDQDLRTTAAPVFRNVVRVNSNGGGLALRRLSDDGNNYITYQKSDGTEIGWSGFGGSDKTEMSVYNNIGPLRLGGSTITATNTLYAENMILTKGPVYTRDYTVPEKQVRVMYDNGPDDAGKITSVHSGNVFKPLMFAASSLLFKESGGTEGSGGTHEILTSKGGAIKNGAWLTMYNSATEGDQIFDFVTSAGTRRGFMGRIAGGGTPGMYINNTKSGNNLVVRDNGYMEYDGTTNLLSNLIVKSNTGNANNWGLWMNGGNTAGNQIAFGSGPGDYVNVIGTRFSGSESVWVQNGYQPIYNADSWKQAAAFAQTRAIIMENGYDTKDLRHVYLHYALPGKAQANHATFWDRVLRFELSITGDENWYIDTTNGDDARYDGRSWAQPKKTIAGVMKNLPKTINGFVSIQLRGANVLTEDIIFDGYDGKGTIFINGNNIVVKSISVRNCSCFVSVSAVWCNGFDPFETTASIYVLNSGNVSLSGCVANSSIQNYGLWAKGKSFVYANNCTFANRPNGIVASLGGHIHSATNYGSGNVYGMSTSTGGLITKGNSQNPTGTTANETWDTGGQIR